MGKILLVLAVGVGCLVTVGCGESGHDAPVSARDDGSWTVLNAPDGFPNVASRCDPFVEGQRIYVTTHHGAAEPIVRAADENCHATGSSASTTTGPS